MKYLRGIFNDGLTRAAGAIFLMVCAVVLFSNYSDLPQRYPLFGVFVFLMVPLLFVSGGIVFVFAILRLLK